MNDQDIAKELTEKFKGGRFVEMQFIPGLPGTFTIVLEGPEETMGTLSFRPAMSTHVTLHQVQSEAKLNITGVPFRK